VSWVKGGASIEEWAETEDRDMHWVSDGCAWGQLGRGGRGWVVVVVYKHHARHACQRTSMRYESRRRYRRRQGPTGSACCRSVAPPLANVLVANDAVRDSDTLASRDAGNFGRWVGRRHRASATQGEWGGALRFAKHRSTQTAESWGFSQLAQSKQPARAHASTPPPEPPGHARAAQCAPPAIIYAVRVRRRPTCDGRGNSAPLNALLYDGRCRLSFEWHEC